jgi:membrane protein DedA with SNARE-associated domain
MWLGYAGAMPLDLSALLLPHAGVLVAGIFGNLYDFFLRAFESYGYLIVFLPILGECAGLPLPGETVLLAGGVAAQKGVLSLPWVIVVAAAAAIIGDNLGYAVGRRGGRPLILRYGRVLRVRDRQMAVLDSYFRRHGAKTVFFGRWVIFLRVWVSLMSGASRLDYKRFLFWNALGGILWATSMSMLAYFFAGSVQMIGDIFGIVGWTLAIVVGIAVGVFIWRLEHRAERREELRLVEDEIAAERAAADAKRRERRDGAAKP